MVATDGMEPVEAGVARRPAQMWKLVLSYDGSDFFGWQVQPGLRTVQGELQRVLREVVGEAVLPQGSGRTDTGVHAEGQVVSVPLNAAIPPERLLRALNRRLPGSVRVLSAEVAAPEFHARGAVAWKQYRYCVFPRRQPGGSEERICPPLLARSVWDCRWPLELDRMQRAARDVVGKHDFSSFAAMDPDRSGRVEVGGGISLEKAAGRSPDLSAGRSMERTIFASVWTAAQDGLLVYRVSGSGFLHHMVRNLVGTFVEIGAGRRAADSLPGLIEERKRSAAGVTAPPQGLSLERVVYRGEPEAELYAGDVCRGAEVEICA